MIDVHTLPLVNACLNGAASVLLVAGWRAIRGGHVARHKTCMVGALVLSTLFLASYVTYHAAVGSVRFTSTGWERPLYYAVLLTHVPLARWCCRWRFSPWAGRSAGGSTRTGGSPAGRCRSGSTCRPLASSSISCCISYFRPLI